MKVYYTAILFTAFLFFLSACSESGVSLPNSSTFVHYYNDGFQDQAIDLLETSDHGLLILSNSLTTTGADFILLRKVDRYGNTVSSWPTKISAAKGSLTAKNIVAYRDNSGVDSAYVLVGTKISGGKMNLFVARTDKNGVLTDSASYSVKIQNSSSQSFVAGYGVAQSTKWTRDIFVLGQIFSSAQITSDGSNNAFPNDMFFAKIYGKSPGGSIKALDTAFTRVYGAGVTTLSNRLYLDLAEQHVFWGGTRSDGNGTRIRIISSGFTSRTPDFDYPYPVAGTGTAGQYVASDFCPAGFGYAFTGSFVPLAGTNISYDSTLFAKMDDAGNLLTLKGNTLVTHTAKDTYYTVQGNSICYTQDGGFLILGSALAEPVGGTNTDYYLRKVDGSGRKQWEIFQGGKYPDLGVRVLQSLDGGYVVLGTTTLANVQTVVLMKTDQQGNIQ
jgi:hypothetical protein